MASVNNTSKNSAITVSNEEKKGGDAITWDEAIDTWDEYTTSTWDTPEVAVNEESKNSAVSVNNESKN